MQLVIKYRGLRLAAAAWPTHSDFWMQNIGTAQDRRSNVGNYVSADMPPQAALLVHGRTGPGLCAIGSMKVRCESAWLLHFAALCCCTAHSFGLSNLTSQQRELGIGCQRTGLLAAWEVVSGLPQTSALQADGRFGVVAE